MVWQIANNVDLQGGKKMLDERCYLLFINPNFMKRVFIRQINVLSLFMFY